MWNDHDTIPLGPRQLLSDSLPDKGGPGWVFQNPVPLLVDVCFSRGLWKHVTAGRRVAVDLPIRLMQSAQDRGHRAGLFQKPLPLSIH